MHKDAQTVHKAPIYSVDNIKGVNKRLFKKFLQVIEELVDEYGYIAFDKVTVRRIREKIGISERTFWKYVDVLIKAGLLQYIDKGLYRYAQRIAPWVNLPTYSLLTAEEKKHIVTPIWLHDRTVNRMLSLLFEKARLHNFRLYFSLKYEYKEKKTIYDNIGTIRIENKKLILYLPSREYTEDLIDALDDVAKVLVNIDNIRNYIIDNYKYFVNRLEKLRFELSFVYRDNVDIDIDFGNAYIDDNIRVVIKKDKSTGKWEYEVLVRLDANNIHKAFRILTFMSNKFIWDFLITQYQKIDRTEKNTEEIKQMLKQILEKLEKEKK